jgi:hypothetical protein
MTYEIKVTLNPLAGIIQRLAENKAARDRLASEETELLAEALRGLPQSVESPADTGEFLTREGEA